MLEPQCKRSGVSRRTVQGNSSDVQFPRNLHRCRYCLKFLVTIEAMQKILVVDDDPHIREVVCFALQQAGFQTVTAADGAQALSQHDMHRPDLVVLDILMPQMDGLAVCQSLRHISPVPIVLLSSRDEEVDRIVGLEMGADDYVCKPFSPRELVARVKANLRRSSGVLAGATRAPANLQVDNYDLDPESYKVTWNGTPLDLTHTEFLLFKTFLAQPEKVFTRDELMGGAYEVRRIVSHRTIDSHIRRLRSKLLEAGAPGIHTLHGVGYRLTRA